MSMETAKYDLISPTAKLVAYWRQFSDIPFAKEVADYVDAAATVATLFPESSSPMEKSLTWTVPYIEARYKCIMQIVEREGITQVLELASGLSLRGLATTAADSSITYVETDLQALHHEKVQAVHHIVKKAGLDLPKKLHLSPANCLNLEDLLQACAPFDLGKPIAIVHEGLAVYLTKPEKQQLAKNVAHLLATYGGIWLSPDFEAKKAFAGEGPWQGEDGSQMMAAIAKATKRDFMDCAYNDEAEIASFFQEHGFSSETLPMIGPDLKLNSLKDTTFNPEELNKYLASFRLHLLRLRQKATSN